MNIGKLTNLNSIVSDMSLIASLTKYLCNSKTHCVENIFGIDKNKKLTRTQVKSNLITYNVPSINSL